MAAGSWLPFIGIDLAQAMGWHKTFVGTLFVAAKLAKAGIGEITRALWPLLAAAVVALMIITFVPSLTTVVWRLMN